MIQSEIQSEIQVEMKLQNMSHVKLKNVYIRMFGKRIFYKKQKFINLLLKPLSHKYLYRSPPPIKRKKKTEKGKKVYMKVY